MKLFKRLLLFTVITTAFVIGLTLGANALDATGQCGDNVYWNYNSSTKELVISGTGDMWDYDDYEDEDGYGYHSPFNFTDIKSVTINDGVTGIGDVAFYCCKNLYSIIIPDSVLCIGELAFKNCENLQSLTLNSGIKNIEYRAFSSCKSLTQLIIPGTVENIGESAFDLCEGITSITIENGVKTIGEGAFIWCGSLREIRIPKSIKEIGDQAFHHCDSLERVYITDLEAWMNIDFHYWYNKSHRSNPLSNGAQLYLNNNLVTELIVPEGIETIGGIAFEGCTSIVDLVLPKSLTNIGTFTFYGCENLKNVYYAGTNAEWGQINIGERNWYLTNANIYFNQTSHTHSYTSKITKAATCTATGLKTYTCSCNHTYTETIKATGHKGGTATCKVKAKCSVCGTYYGSLKSHTYTNSCDTDCNVCKTKRTIKHTLITLPAKSPTYISTGLTEGKKCKVCGKVTVAQKTVAKKKLSKVKIKKSKSTKRKILSLAWGKVTAATRYQVQYSTTKSFKKKTTKTTKSTKLTIKKLKSKKNYYVRVRAYKVENGQKVYGSWSTVKKVKIK